MPQILRRSALLLLFWILLLDWALVAIVWQILAENPDRLFVAPFVPATAIATICFLFPNVFILLVFLLFVGPALLVRGEARDAHAERPAGRSMAVLLFALACVVAEFAISLVLAIAMGVLANLTPGVFSAELSARLVVYLGGTALITTVNSALTITAIAAAIQQIRAGGAEPDVASAFD